MPAADLETMLRRVGWAFVVALFLQLRVDERLVLLPFTAALVAVAVWMMRSFAESPEADRAWRGAFGSAVAAVVIGAVGLVPAVEPGFTSVLATIVLLLGTISHCSLMAGWSVRAGWPTAVQAYEQARSWCTINLGVVAFGIACLLVLGERPLAGESGAIAPGVVLGRVFEGVTVIVAVVIVTVLWIAAMYTLQKANRIVRAGLDGQPDSEVPLA